MAIVIFGLFDYSFRYARSASIMAAAAAAAAAAKQAMDDAVDDIVNYHVEVETNIHKPLTKRTADRLEAFTRDYGVLRLMRETLYAELKGAPLPKNQVAFLSFRSAQNANKTIVTAFKIVLGKLAAEVIPEVDLNDQWLGWMVALLTTDRAKEAKAWRQHHPGAFPAKLTPAGWAAAFQAIIAFGTPAAHPPAAAISAPAVAEGAAVQPPPPCKKAKKTNTAAAAAAAAAAANADDEDDDANDHAPAAHAANNNAGHQGAAVQSAAEPAAKKAKKTNTAAAAAAAAAAANADDQEDDANVSDNDVIFVKAVTCGAPSIVATRIARVNQLVPGGIAKFIRYLVRTVDGGDFEHFCSHELLIDEQL